MIAHLLSPSGRIGRVGYVAPVAAFFALALISAFGTGATLSAASIGEVLDRPFTMIGRGLDASALALLPAPVAIAVATLLFTAAVWGLFVLTVKRLHDLGRSGWWAALLLVPGVSVLLMLFCAAAPGRQGAAA